MRNLTLKALALAVVALFCAGMISPASAFAEDADFAAGNADELATQAGNIASGTAGTCAWDISSDGTLTIHPGTIPDTGLWPYPWWSHAESIKRVVFSQENGKKVVPTSCAGLLRQLSYAESIDLTGIDTSAVTDMSGMFDGCTLLQSLDLSPLDTSAVTNMTNMFRDCSSLKSLNLVPLKTSAVTDMNFVFDGCSSLQSLDLSSLDTSAATDIFGIFQGCSSLKSVNLSGLNLSQISGLDYVFHGCSSLTSLDTSGINVSSVVSLCATFYDCSSLVYLDLSGLNMGSLSNTNSTFYGCSSLKSLDISSFNMPSTCWAGGVLDGCSSLERISLGKNMKSESFEMPFIEVNGHLNWYSTAEKEWFWPSEIEQNRLGIADTYLKLKEEGSQGSGGNGQGSGGGSGSQGDGLGGNGSQGGGFVRASLEDYAGVAAASEHPDLVATDWYMKVPDGAFRNTAVLYLDYTLGRGLMSGYTDGTNRFDPWGRMDRGMAITVIYRMATGFTADTTDNNVDAGFSDVHPGDWYAAAVAWGKRNGITTGYEDGSRRFGPTDKVTREQLATMIARYCEKMGGMSATDGDVSMFDDRALISDWARDGVAFCYNHDIVSGMGGTYNFAPGDIAQRCQMAKIIAVTARMFE